MWFGLPSMTSKGSNLQRKGGHNFGINKNFSEVNIAEYDRLVTSDGCAPNICTWIRVCWKLPATSLKPTSLLRWFVMVHRNLWLLAYWRDVDPLPTPLSVAMSPIGGAEYVQIPVYQAMTEGNMVSALAWPAHPAWMSKFLTFMGAKIEL